MKRSFLLANLVVLVAVTAAVTLPVDAATISLNPLGGGEDYGNLADTGLGDTAPLVVASQIVNVFLRVLGAITVFFQFCKGGMVLVT